MDVKSLVEIIMKYDKDGKIINELIDKKLVNKDEIFNFSLNSSDFDVIYYVARYINGIDINKLEDKVIKIGTGEDICKFAKDVNGVNVGRLEDKIIDLNNAKYICLFAQYMEEKGANFERLENKIIEIGDGADICRFARCTFGADLKRLEDKIIEIGEGQYICEFASSANDADMDRLADAIIKTKDNYLITYFAIKPNAPVSKLLNAVINSDDYDGINFAIRMFGDRYTEKFVDLISIMENPYTIYNFVEKYNSKLDKLSLEKLTDGIIKSAVNCDDMYALEIFVENIEGVPVRKIREVIANYYNGFYKDGYVEKNNLKVKKKLFNRKK